MNRTVKSKLIHLWNRTLRHFMVEEDSTVRSHTLNEPSYEALSSTLSAIPDLMFELDEEGRYWDVHVLRPELLVAPAEELIGRTAEEVLPPEAAKTAMQALDEANKKGYSHGKHIFLPTPAGERWFEVSISRKEPSPNQASQPGGQRFIVLSRDIHERKLAYLEAERLAYLDQLTELPNRYALKEGRLFDLDTQQKPPHYRGILFLDLDDFKRINDRHGHHVGDSLLKAVADRLRSAVREEDIVVRWAGDEFLILITTLPNDFHKAHQNVTSICKDILETVSQPYVLDNETLTCHTSIGVRLFNDSDTDFELLVQQADEAMYVAKKSKQRYAFYPGAQPGFILAKP